MSWEKPVYSKRAVSIAYDDQTQEMTVTWKNGKATVYSGVPESVALDLAHAPSVGNMINSDITPNYTYRNVG